MAVLKAFLVNNKFEEDEIHALIESLDVYADNFMKEIDEINSVKGRHRYSEKPFVAECFRCGAERYRTDPEIQCDEIYEVIMVGILFYAVNTVVVNRMTRYQNRKYSLQQQGYA
jgi:hypothetical protein